jgi:hypothetical protein
MAKAEHALVIRTASLTYGSELKRGSCSFRNLSPNILARFSPVEIISNIYLVFMVNWEGKNTLHRK